MSSNIRELTRLAIKRKRAQENSPLLSKDSYGNNICILCKITLSSTDTWEKHVNSEDHRSVKTFKINIRILRRLHT